MEGFEAEHWSCNSFDETMILFHDIVEVFRLDNADDLARPREFEDNVDALQTSEIGAALVDHNAFWDTVGANGAFEKPSGGSRIAVLSQHKFKGLAVAIDSAVQVGPLATVLSQIFPLFEVQYSAGTVIQRVQQTA